MRFVVTVFVLWLGLAWIAPGLHATTVVPPEFPELVSASDYIVRGRVTNIAYETRPHRGRAVIHTRVTLEVLEVVAGNPPQMVVLTMLGGRTADGEMRVAGVPTFAVGDEDILFVKDNGKNFHPLHGIMHGRYPVKRDKATGREYVTRSNGVPLTDVAEVTLPMSDGPATALQRRLRLASEALSVEQFVTAVRQTRAAKNPEGRRHAK